MRWLREPLVHFLALGTLLFLAFEWRGGGGPESRRIVITPGQVDAIVAGFVRTWQRPPTEQEVKDLLDDFVREEIAAREAVAAGLDRGDTIVRRRLRQKFEFLAEDALDDAAPTEAELQAWLDGHPARYREEDRFAFRHVFLSPERRGAALEGEARTVLARLESMAPDSDVGWKGADLGDPILLPAEVPLASVGEVTGMFGPDFARALAALEPGRWSGPVRSGYGLHLVFVRERSAGRVPSLADVRAEVERDLTEDRRRRRLDALYEQLLARYRVSVDRRPEAGASDGP